MNNDFPGSVVSPKELATAISVARRTALLEAKAICQNQYTASDCEYAILNLIESESECQQLKA